MVTNALLPTETASVVAVAVVAAAVVAVVVAVVAVSCSRRRCFCFSSFVVFSSTVAIAVRAMASSFMGPPSARRVAGNTNT